MATKKRKEAGEKSASRTSRTRYRGAERAFEIMAQKYPDYASMDLAGAIEEGIALSRRDTK